MKISPLYTKYKSEYLTFIFNKEGKPPLVILHNFFVKIVS